MTNEDWLTSKARSVYRKHGFTLAFALIGVLVIAVGIFVVRDLRSASQEVRQMNAGSVRGLDLIGELQYQTQEARRSMLYALTTSDSNLQVEYADQSRAADARVAELIREHTAQEHLNGQSLREDQALGQFHADWAEYLKIRNSVIALILQGDAKEAVSRDLGEGVPAFNKVRDDLQEIKLLHKQEAESQIAEVEASSNRSLLKLIAILCITQLAAVVAVRMVQKGLMLRSVQQSESRMREVIESINEGMVVISEEGRIELWNEAAQRISGRLREQVVGRGLREAIPGLDTNRLQTAIAEAKATGVASSIQDLKFIGDYSERVFEARVFPFEGGTTVFFNDVTEKKKADATLRDSEERFRNLFENSPIGIYRTTPDGHVLVANQPLVRMLGYSSFEELASRNLEEQEFEPDYRRRTFKEVLERDGVIRGMESAWHRRDGSAVYVRENARVVRDERGTPLYYEGTVEDVTEWKQAEEALRESQALFNSLVNSLPQKIFCKDLDGRFTFGNTGFCLAMGRSLAEIVGKTDLDLFPPELAEKYRDDDRRVLETGRLLDAVEEHQAAEGERQYVQVVKTPRFDSRGQVVGIQGIFWDVTEQKLAELELARERDLLHALMDNIPDSIFFKDAKGRFTRINRAHAELLGSGDPAQAVGKTDADFFTPDSLAEVYAGESNIRRTGLALIGAVEQLTRREGSSHWMLSTKVPIRGSDGRVSGIIGISKDITERRLAEEALDGSLADFLDIVSSVSEGDLTKRGPEGDDTLGRIAASVNKMLDNFNAMLNQVREIGLAVSSSATEILYSSQQMADGSNRQAEEITNTSSAVEEMAASMSQVSRNAEASAAAGRRALETAEHGDRAVSDTSEAMSRINAAVEQTAGKMKRLSQRSSEISDIIDLINGVASQTNLLSLNAAIEAAHAGEAGLGFSVVAEEIRKLAERSARATKEVNNLIKAIQVETAEALAAMEKGMQEVKEGTLLASEARQSLDEISSAVRQASQLIEEISAASEEQARSTRNVAKAMQTISSVTLETSAGAQQAAETIKGMVSLSDHLAKAILQFKVLEDAGLSPNAAGAEPTA